jgi:hypothetical protein
MKHAALAVIAAVATAGCGTESSGAHSPFVSLPGTSVPVTEIPLEPPPAPAYASRSGYAEPARLVLRSQEEWTSAWATIHEGVTPPPDLPAVDFGAELVALAALGTRPSGGFGVAVTNAAADAGTLRIGVVESMPGPGCFTTTAITQPVAAARMPRHEGPVEFVDLSIAVRCE